MTQPPTQSVFPAGPRLSKDSGERLLSFPVSFAQQRLWFLDQLEPASGAYNIPIALRLRGDLDVAALERGLNEILRRHDALRTCFPARHGEPVQVISPPRPMPLPEVDLRVVADAQREAEILRLAAEEGAAPFDLERGPLVRGRRLRLAAEEHVLLLTMHHIVSDGWSMGVLLTELATLYQAFHGGLASPLPELPIQYADYALWQRQRLQGETLEQELSYWKTRLRGTPTLLELPTDKPRPAVASFRGAIESATLPRAILDALKALSQQEGMTLFMTLLAAFQTLLARYAGQDDIWIGSPIAGRTQLETEGLIGFFVNTLVLRGDLSGDPTFRQLLGRVREVALGAYSHQEMPFEKLVEELQPARSLGITPLFQVMFSLQPASKEIEIPGLATTRMRVPRDAAHFDLSLSTSEKRDGLFCSLEYRTDLFETATIRRMLGHLEVLLGGIAADPDRRLSQLPLLTSGDRHQVLVEWNRTETDYPRGKTVHRLFEEQAARTPEAVALELEGGRLTYGELNRQSNLLAQHLRSLGVGRETLVGLCVKRSLEMVVALFGILKAGGAYMPLDPDYPAERLRFMLEDSGASLVLTEEAVTANRPPLPARTVVLEALRGAIAAESVEEVDSGVTEQDLAYVIYTSGSTGKPKGVEIEHRSLANYTQYAADLFAVAAEDRILQFASLSFDTAAEEIFATLSRGATLVLRTEEMIETVATFLAKCREWSLTVLDLPTSYWHELTAAAREEALSIPESLRLIVIGGEKAVPERFAQWREMVGDRIQFLNGYGPAEATVAATFWEPAAGVGNSVSRMIPIGHPIANVRTHVLDGDLQPVPIGVVGELYIGGAGLARGYRNRPALTAERFIRDPFRNGNERLYRTGDRVRYRPGGDLEYLGRIDDQVKLRGFRVEPGEVEAALRGIVGVREAVVKAHEDMPGQARLVGYVVADPSRPPSVSDLRRLLKEKLPAYMVPSTFVLLDTMPLTPSGKLDTASLPAPETARPGLERAYEHPRTPVEQTLAEIWKRLLRLDQIGIHDDFFELGGHSLLATQVISRARDAFGVDVSLRDLFADPTIAGLAFAVAQRQAETVAPAEMNRILDELEARGDGPPAGR